jgi:copper chaperone
VPAVETIVITVTGMTCQHCVTAVRGEIANIPGVAEVAVDLDSGAVTILADPVPADEALRAAVTEAGYELGAVN